MGTREPECEFQVSVGKRSNVRVALRRHRRDFLGGNSYRVDRLSAVHRGDSLIRGSTFIIRGASNSVELGDLSTIDHCRIRITGNRNRILVGARAFLRQVDLVIEDDDNVIIIGESTRVYERSLLAAIEGTTLSIGAQCMIASDCQFRTGDSHSVTDLSGRRLNPAKDITIGEHVWCGTRVLCLAGAAIARESVVGAGALVNGMQSEENVVVAGVPARVVKRDVRWCAERL